MTHMKRQRIINSTEKLEQLQGVEMARPKRFELLTPRFVVWCSIQLSYGRVLRGKSCCESGLSARHSYRLERALARRDQPCARAPRCADNSTARSGIVSRNV